jgi:hypothetical protein
MKYKILVMSFFILLILAGCQTQNNDIIPDTNVEKTLVTGNVYFRAFTEIDEGVEDVSILLIDSAGEVMDVLTTDEKGEVVQSITVPLDEKYAQTEDRGTVTVIAYKEGYRAVVIYELAIRDEQMQLFYMTPEVQGEYNEAIGILSNIDQDDIEALVEKYID